MRSELSCCLVCFSSHLKPLPFGYKFNGRWLDGIECKDCGIIFIQPQPTSEEIKTLYSKEYFDGGYRCGHEGSYFNDETLSRLTDYELLRRIKYYKPDGKFLEIGCAGGAFLNAAKKVGYEAFGIEFSQEAAQFARTKFGLDVVTGDLTSETFTSKTFDVVFMGDVLEHLPNPVDTMKLINSIMKIQGLLVILCPMQTNTMFSRLGFSIYKGIGKKAIVQLPPYHLFEYRSKSISNLIRRYGFEIVSLREFAMLPSEISLRGTSLQKLMKKFFQYPNYLTTKVFNKYGDRIELFALKQSDISS